MPLQRLSNLPAVYDFFFDNWDAYADGNTNFDPTFLKLPATTPSLYVNYEDPNASDSNDGLSWDSPLKTLNAAVAKDSYERIVVKSGTRCYLDSLPSATSSWNINLNIVTDGAERAEIVYGPEDISAGFSATSGRSGVFEATLGNPLSMWDETDPSSPVEGAWGFLVNRLNLDLVESLGGWYRDSDTGILYIKLFDNRAPDNKVRFEPRADEDTRVAFYTENIAFYCISLRPRFYGQRQYVMNNCECAYSTSAAQYRNMAAQGTEPESYIYNCHFHSSKQDLLSNTANSRLVVINTRAVFCLSGGASINAMTGHGHSIMLGINSVLGNTPHNVVGDTSGNGGSLYVACRGFKTIPEYADDNNYGIFKFENDEENDTSLGIFINCSCKDDDGNETLGRTGLGQGNIATYGNDFGFSMYGTATNSDALIYLEEELIPPQADAGTGATIEAGDAIFLDSSSSIQGDGAIVSRVWEQVSGSRALTITQARAVSTTATDTLVSGPEDYTFRVTVTDENGLTSFAEVTFVVQDKTGPEMLLIDGDITWPVGVPWEEPGFIATDKVDGDVTDSVVAGVPNVENEGNQQVKYIGIDSSGNTSEAYRNVQVLAATALLEALETKRFEMVYDGNIQMFEGRSNREIFQFKPDSTEGLPTVGEFLDLTIFQKVEVISGPDTFTSSESDKRMIRGTMLVPRLGDITIKNKATLDLTVVGYLPGDALGFVLAASEKVPLAKAIVIPKRQVPRSN